MTLSPALPLEALPAAAHLHADDRFAGRGITIGVVDAGFHPHPDLVRPLNRIRAWVDASTEDMEARYFEPYDVPRWPEMPDSQRGGEWHGLMTSVTAAGNGYLSDGRYRGLAFESDLVLVQAGRDNAIAGSAIVRALRWLRQAARALNIRVVSLSVAGDEEQELEIDDAVEALTADGVVVVAAAGNDGIRRLLPPATSLDAITVGGVDDHNTLQAEAWEVWHSNFGETTAHVPKPEVIAPTLWTVAPLLPGTETADEARRLLAAVETAADSSVGEWQLVSPHYHFVEGTSVAAPLVASVAACMLEANRSLTPEQIKRLLVETATCVRGDAERQGGGAVNAAAAIAAALQA
jgi:serine protease AprX